MYWRTKTWRGEERCYEGHSKRWGIGRAVVRTEMSMVREDISSQMELTKDPRRLRYVKVDYLTSGGVNRTWWRASEGIKVLLESPKDRCFRCSPLTSSNANWTTVQRRLRVRAARQWSEYSASKCSAGQESTERASGRAWSWNSGSK